jgi:hypothetical protein
MAKSPQNFGVPDVYWDEQTATLSQAIGFFLVCFGRLELTITLTLAIVLGYDKDYERFGVIASNLNASGRVARLRQAANLCKIPLGENLKALLALFVKNDCEIRNNICHSWPIMDGEEIVHFGNLSAIPKFMGRGPHRPTGLDPTAHSIGHLYERALWILKFNSELIRVIRLRPIESLEVDPKNLSPPPVPQARATAAGPTKIGRRALKARRKALRKPPAA